MSAAPRETVSAGSDRLALEPSTKETVWLGEANASG